MPLAESQQTITPTWGVLGLKLFPHPDDLAELAANGGELPVEYKPKSVLAAAYGRFEDDAQYEATPAGSFPDSRVATGYFRVSGEAVRPIVNMVAFHAAASNIIADALSGTLTEDVERVDEARRVMAGAQADFQFGTSPFTVTAPE